MSEKAVLEALQKNIITAVAASTLPAASVKYVARNFTKPSNGKWLEVVHIPNNFESEFWGSEKTYNGILRLILHWPMNDKGAYEPLTLIESIASSFSKGTKLNDPSNTVTVRITNNPNFLGVLEEPPEILFPVSIQYQFFSA